jgi:hypothetical protein
MRNFLLALAMSVAAVASAKAASIPVVVELFTSQGCSDCPPAVANLRAIADRPGVLALSFSVTYWDRLGWKDTFGKPEFTQRQYDYARALHGEAYTPEVIVNGRSDLVGNVKSDIERRIAGQQPLMGPALSLSSGKLTIAAGAPPAHAADVWLVRYDPRLVNVAIGRGENAGTTLPHKNVVHELTKLGAWNGNAETFAVPAASDGLSTAVLVQEESGPILSALKG